MLSIGGRLRDSNRKYSTVGSMSVTCGNLSNNLNGEGGGDRSEGVEEEEEEEKVERVDCSQFDRERL